MQMEQSLPFSEEKYFTVGGKKTVHSIGICMSKSSPVSYMLGVHV